MHIKIEKELLIENINIVQKAISGRTSIPILECFLLICDANGFRMVSTDLEIGIKTENIECEVFEEGSAALPSKFFSDVVRRLPEGVVSIKTGDGFITVINCLNSEFKIVGRNPEEYPELPEVERDNKFTLKQGVLKNLIRQTIFSICQDETKPNLAGALVEISGEINMVTCDTFRVSFTRGELSGGETNQASNIIIPSKTINEMYKLLVKDSGDVNLYITEKHVMLDIGSCVVVSRLIEGEFINYSNIFPEEFETKISLNTEAFSAALERAVLVSYYENKKNPVRMKIEDNSLFITTAAETGNASDEIEVDLSGKNIEIAFNPRFLLDAVKCIDEEELTIGFNTPLSPCVIKPAGVDGDIKYLILPLRLKS